MTKGLKILYQETIVPKLKEQFGYKNIHQVPKLVKVSLNRGLGEASQNAKALESSVNEIVTKRTVARFIAVNLLAWVIGSAG
ncbi:MAG: 50S ribosomal protein L5, partial [Moorea sp. SIO2B7]|nr:50S ribosomal protein L5 [Moorena sp. SIO2B7]